MGQLVAKGCLVVALLSRAAQMVAMDKVAGKMGLVVGGLAAEMVERWP